MAFLEAEQQALRFLMNFTPLIQLWAGICLLFFYLKLLEKSPLHSHIKKANKKFNKLEDRIRYQIQGIIYNNKKSTKANLSAKWQRHFVPRVKNMAALTFFYCLFIILATGFERYCKYELNSTTKPACAHPIYLITTSACILFYNIICSSVDLRIRKKVKISRKWLNTSFIIKLRPFHTYITPISYSIFLFILYFVLFKYTESGLYGLVDWISKKCNGEPYVVILLLITLTLITGMLSVLIYIIRDWMKLLIMSVKIDRLSRDITSLFKVYNNPLLFEKLPKVIQNRCRRFHNKKKNERVNFSRKQMMQFIEFEIKNRYAKI